MSARRLRGAGTARPSTAASSKRPEPSPATSAPSPTSRSSPCSSARTTSASCRSAHGRSSGIPSESTSAPRSTTSSALPRPPARRGRRPSTRSPSGTSRRRTSSGPAHSARPGCGRGDSVLHCFGLSMFLAGVPVVRALERMGARPIPVGAEAGTERILRIADLVRPRVLACTPSYAQYLAEQVPKVLGRPASELGIEIILCAGEPGAGLPEVRAGLQQAFGAKLYDLLGGAHGVMCCSCDVEPYAGMHVLGEDCAITTQLVDQETRAPIPLVEGAIGERVKTSLHWEAAATAPRLGRRRLPGAHRSVRVRRPRPPHPRPRPHRRPPHRQGRQDLPRRGEERRPGAPAPDDRDLPDRARRASASRRAAAQDLGRARRGRRRRRAPPRLRPSSRRSSTRG